MRLNGVYQPKPRRAYGRRFTSAPLVEEVARNQILTIADVTERTSGLCVRDARSAHRYLQCPDCGRRARRLYSALTHEGTWWLCRICSGLRYDSQYAGRRPEATPERLFELRDKAMRVKSPKARKRRLARLNKLCNAATKRHMEEDQRTDRAFILAALPILINAQAREAKAWRRVLIVTLREKPETRRAIARSPDTPDWVSKVLRASLRKSCGMTGNRKVKAPNEREVVESATKQFRDWHRALRQQAA